MKQRKIYPSKPSTIERIALRKNPGGRNPDDGLWFIDIMLTEHTQPQTRFLLERMWYERAAKEGRLDPEIAAEMRLEPGKFTCGICGIWTRTEEEADECCLPGVEEFEDLVLAGLNLSVGRRANPFNESQWNKPAPSSAGGMAF